MKRLTHKSTAIFERAFTLRGLHETLPAGVYAIETEVTATPWGDDPDSRKAMVRILLQPRASHPSMVRHLTLSLDALNAALAQDSSLRPDSSLWPAPDLAFAAGLLATGLPETRERPDPSNGAAQTDSALRQRAPHRAPQVAENEGTPVLAIKR